MKCNTKKHWILRIISIIFLFLLFTGCNLGFIEKSKIGSYSLEGYVRKSDGTPVAGVQVAAADIDAVAMTGADGKYLLSNLPGRTLHLKATKEGFVFILDFKAQGSSSYGGVSVPLEAHKGKVSDVDFICAAPGEVTIPISQGSGARSPLEGQEVFSVRGVVTMVTRQTAHVIYDTTLYDATVVPQWVSEDGFFMEAFGPDKDGNPATSDGIFISTHDPLYEGSQWKEGIDSGIEPGDVVFVSGIVREVRPMSRFNESTSHLTRTVIDAHTVIPFSQGGVKKTEPLPEGVMLTYSKPDSSYTGEYVIMPWNDTSPSSLQNAVDKLEAVEGMLIQIKNPIVTGPTHYNITGVMADSGKKDGEYSGTFNTEWLAPVLDKNDFNTELLYVDYQSPDWRTFQPIPQIGDVLIDKNSNELFRGVMDYTADALYMARPLESQGWNFISTKSSYPTEIQTFFKNLSTINQEKIRDWRIGDNPDARFVVPWNEAEDDALTVASFNIENYVNQGKPYDKDKDIADIVKNNLKFPDVLIIVEMGDDNESDVVYANQADSWAYKDGVVSAVLNYRGIIDKIHDLGVSYDFRQIDPKELDFGGAPGVNIRLGFMYRTDRVAFVDRGLVTNHYENTNGDPSTWPVQAPGVQGDLLADAETGVFTDETGPHLTQSPGLIQDAAFARSRRSLAGEFIFKKTGKTFFVVANHLSSKGGDMPLYGEIQPPLLKSEANRNRQALAVNKLVSNILRGDPEAYVIVGGDMNDFGFSLPLKTLTGEAQGKQVLYSPSEEFMPVTERFSYSFRGNLQQIDHILISPALYENVYSEGKTNWKNVCYIPHINSLFSRNNHIATSDHDPEALRLKGGW